MPYELSWLVEKRVILARFHGVITAEELKRFLPEQHALVAEGTPPIHHINDTTDTGPFEVKLDKLQALLKMLKRPEGVGWYVEANPHPIGRMTSSIALQIAGRRHRVVSTLEEAVAFLQQNDETLPPITIPDQSV